MKKVITFRIDADIDRALRKLLKERRGSLAALINYLLSKALKKEV